MTVITEFAVPMHGEDNRLSVIHSAFVLQQRERNQENGSLIMNIILLNKEMGF